MAMLGKRRPPRPASGHSGLARTPSEKGLPAVPSHQSDSSQPLMIERLAHDGRGVARNAEGKTVFVSHALPGEQVVVGVHVTRKRFDEAHIKAQLTSSPQRVTPPCPHFGQCGGCDLQHLEINAQRAHKREVLTELMARQGITLPAIHVINGQHESYRRRARLSVNVDSRQNVRLGFRAHHSHRVIDIHHCHVLVPELQALLNPLRELLVTLDAPRHVGHIELIATNTAIVVLVRQLKEHVNDRKRWQRFAEQQQLQVGCWLGRDTPALHWYGATPELIDTLTPALAASDLPQTQTPPIIHLQLMPGDFLQVNAEVNRALVAQVMAWLSPMKGQKLADLFAGIGNFSLPLAAAGAQVHAVEGSAAMVERIQANAHRNQLAVTAQQADLSDRRVVRQLLNECPVDALVLDPPRSGAEAICQALGDYKVPNVIYVSCDPATLARDAAHLVHAGYRVQQVAVADMFLHTAHMETLMLFEYEG